MANVSNLAQMRKPATLAAIALLAVGLSFSPNGEDEAGVAVFAFILYLLLAD